jgi:hypothetical protein
MHAEGQINSKAPFQLEKLKGNNDRHVVAEGIILILLN